MTTTASISGQSIGTGANIGYGLFPRKVTRQVTTTAFVIAAKVTNGAAGYTPQQEIRIWYSSSSFSVLAADAAAALHDTARYLDVKPDALAGGIEIKDSSLEPITGDYIYLWCDIPTVAVAQTLDVNVVELP